MQQLSKDQRKHLAKQALAAFMTGQGRLAAKGFAAAATGQWEGGERDRNRNRPGTRLVSQDTDLDHGNREALLSEARSLAQTYGIVRRIIRQYATYTVGSCRVKWNTGDKAVDKAYEDYWRNWMNMADASGVHNFRKLTKIVVASTIRDGDVFGQKVFLNRFGQLRIIEADRVNNGYGAPTNIDQDAMIGGIRIDAEQRRVSARIWDRDRYGNFKNKKDIPWREIFHVFDPDRADAIRNVTHFHACLNTIRDKKEIGRAEQLAAKRNSKLALLVKNLVGGAGSIAGVDLFANETPTQGGDSKVNVQEVNDTVDAYMFPEEDMKAHTSERPSEGWRWLMEFLIREIAVSLDLPYGVVWNMAGLNGPAVRFEINQAGRTFGSFIEDVLVPKWINPVAGWKIGEGMDKGLVPRHPRWADFSVPKPVYITIDLGRDSKAGIEENRAGLLTATDWFEEMGQDFEEQTDRLAWEESVRQSAAKKYGVEIDRIRLLTPNGNPAGQQEEPQAKAA